MLALTTIGLVTMLSTQAHAQDADGRLYYAIDERDDPDAEMIRYACDDWGRSVTDLSLVRGFDTYSRWADAAGDLRVPPSGQIFDGSVTVNLVGDVSLGHLGEAIAAGTLQNAGMIFARQNAGQPDAYTEHTVFLGPGALNMATIGEGFVYEWVGPGGATWADDQAIIEDTYSVCPNLVYAQEDVVYTGLPSPAGANGFAAGGGLTLYPFEVRQDPNGPVVGYLLRERRKHNGVMKYMDHWALSDDFEYLEEDGGHLAIMTVDSYPYSSLAEWVGKMAEKSPAMTTYAGVGPDVFAPLALDCHGGIGGIQGN
ncbi:MAG: hypothetical protein R3F59_09260 [Myxococcota bacterium]